MMKKYLIIIPLAALMVSSCSVKPPSEGSIVVDMAQKGAAVPESMYGVFFEEINHAGDGGLYAELVQNRSFEEKEYPEGYFADGDKLHAPPLKNHLTSKVTEETLDGTLRIFRHGRWNRKETEKAWMKLTRQNPLNPATPNSLQIIIPKDAGEVVIGKWGLLGNGSKKRGML